MSGEANATANGNGNVPPKEENPSCRCSDEIGEKKKLRFEITSVTDTPSDADDSFDDGDDGDEECAFCEEPKAVIQAPMLVQPNVPLIVAQPVVIGQQKPEIPALPIIQKASSDIDVWKNRFRIVKVGCTRPYVRGKWTVQDYYDDAIPTRHECPPLVTKSLSVPGNYAAASKTTVAKGANGLVKGEESLPKTPPPELLANSKTPGLHPEPSSAPPNLCLPEGVPLEWLAKRIFGETETKKPQAPACNHAEVKKTAKPAVNGTVTVRNGGLAQVCVQQLRRQHSQHQPQHLVVPQNNSPKPNGSVNVRKKSLSAAEVGRSLLASYPHGMRSKLEESLGMVKKILRPALNDDLEAEIEARVAERLAEMDSDARVRSLARRNEQLMSQVQLLRNHVQTLRESVVKLRREKYALERRLGMVSSLPK